MRACDFEREVLSAQIRLEHLGSVGSITQTEQQPRLCGTPLCEMFSRYALSLSAAMLARSAFGTVISALSRRNPSETPLRPERDVRIGSRAASGHADAVDELDVEGILAFAERILPRASDLWVQASLDYKQRLQQLFFPEGIAYDGNRFNRTAVTAPLFKYLARSESADERVVSRVGIEHVGRGVGRSPLA